MKPGKYQHILPAPHTAREGEPSSANSPETTSSPGQKRLGPNARTIACTECRSRKTKCDGRRPACANCLKRGITTCIYPEKLKTGHEALEVLELLKALPESRASTLLSLWRAQGDPAIVLSNFRSGVDGVAQSSAPNPEGSTSSRSLLETELRLNYSRAYPSVTPIDGIALARSNLLRPAQDEDEADGIILPDLGPHAMDEDPPIKDFENPIARLRLIDYCDERLRDLRVGFWTDVMVTNDLAARAISLYIKTDHPLLGLFDPDLFINDLVRQRERYCSRFLFHAVMYLGCQMYNAFDKTAVELADHFREKAESLWDARDNSFPSMAGAVLLSVSLIGHGKDHTVLVYAAEAMKMGLRLGLFHDARTASRKPFDRMSEDEIAASCYAAWGVFNWNVLVSQFYRQPGSESPPSKPIVPIPGEIASTQRPEHLPLGPYSGDGDLLRKTFPAMCQFWNIIHGARWLYYPVQDTPPGFYKIALAEHKYRELIVWVQSLPSFMTRKTGCPAHVTALHIWLHAIILDIFRPFIGGSGDQQPRLLTFLAEDSTPDTAYAASVHQLKTLILEYRSNHVESTYSILWHTGLIYLANAMLKDTDDPEWRTYLLLCIYGYERLNRPYRISEVIIQGLLSMTLRDTDMSGYEAKELMRKLKEYGLKHVKEDLEDRIRAPFMVDLDLAMTNPEQANVETMADDFDNLALFQDFFHRDRMDQ